MNPRQLLVSLSALLFSISALAGADYLQANKTAPVYQLKNLRLEADRFGGELIIFDYQLVRKGTGLARIGGKTDKGPITIAASIPSGQETGTIQLQSFFPSRGNNTQHLELYLYQSVSFIKGGSAHMLLSNSVRLGNPGPSVSGKAWTKQQESDHAEYVRIMNDDSAHKPDKSYPVSVKLPDEHQFVPNTAHLTKGTKLFACYQDGWYNLTAISENSDGTVNVRWTKYGPSSDCAIHRGELIIADEQLASLEKHAANKYPPTEPNIIGTKDPKMIAAPATTSEGKPIKRYAVSIDVPDDSTLVPEDLLIKEGIPLQACYAGKWNPITALSQNDDGTLYVRWNDYGSAFDCNMLRSELIIKKELVTKIKTDPDYKPGIPPLKRKSYPISIVVPSGSELVPKDARIPKGTKLQACWAGKWNPITALAEAGDGTLNIRWDDFGSGFDCSMLRSELIIKTADLKEINGSSPQTPNAFRTWTDSTGKFTVKAKLKSKSATEVVLLTEDDRELTLPITKLSVEDQQFLKADESDNPFK